MAVPKIEAFEDTPSVSSRSGPGARPTRKPATQRAPTDVRPHAQGGVANFGWFLAGFFGWFVLSAVLSIVMYPLIILGLRSAAYATVLLVRFLAIGVIVFFAWRRQPWLAYGALAAFLISLLQYGSVILRLLTGGYL